MSIDLMNRVWWREDIPTTPKFVLLALADRADEDEGICWYAVGTIARKTSLSTRGVRKAIDWLIGASLLKKMHRADRSNFYIIAIDKLPHVERPASSKKEASPIQMLSEPDLFGGVNVVHPSGKRTGERHSARGEPRSATGEPRSPIDHSDSKESPESLARADENRFTIEGFIERWKMLARDFPRVPEHGPAMGEKRAASLLARVTEQLAIGSLNGPYHPGRAGIAAVLDQLFQRIRGSPFLCGEVRDWAISPDWVVGPINWTKTMERRDERTGKNGFERPGGKSAVAAGQRVVDAVRAGREQRTAARNGTAGGQARLAGPDPRA